MIVVVAGTCPRWLLRRLEVQRAVAVVRVPGAARALDAVGRHGADVVVIPDAVAVRPPAAVATQLAVYAPRTMSVLVTDHAPAPAPFFTSLPLTPPELRDPLAPLWDAHDRFTAALDGRSAAIGAGLRRRSATVGAWDGAATTWFPALVTGSEGAPERPAVRSGRRQEPPQPAVVDDRDAAVAGVHQPVAP